MAIRNLQASASCANRLNLTGLIGQSTGIIADDGYYVYGNNFANFAYTERDASILSDQAERNYMCNQNIYTFPSGIRKVGYDDLLSVIYVITSGNDLYAIGHFMRGDNTVSKVYNDFTYVTGNVLDALVNQQGTYVIDTGNRLYMCGTNSSDSMRSALPSGGFGAGSLYTFHKATGIGEDWQHIFVDSKQYGPRDFLVTKTNGNVYRLYREVLNYQVGSNLSGNYLFAGHEGVLAKTTNGDWYGYLTDYSYPKNGVTVYSNRLGTNTGTTNVNHNTFTASTYINNMSENFVKASIGPRGSAFLTDDKKLYVLGYNTYSSIGYTGDMGAYITLPTFLYSGIDDVNLYPYNFIQGGQNHTSMLFISGGNIYGQGLLQLGLYHYPPNDLTNLKYAIDDPYASLPVSGLTFEKPTLIETGNWKHCFHGTPSARNPHRIVWNDTEIGISVIADSYITNKLLYNGIYNDITFISGVNADIFSNVKRQSFKNRTYNCYLSGNECYVWGFPFGGENYNITSSNNDLNQSHIFYPPDSGNYYIKPDTTAPKLHTFLPQKISGNWDKAYIGDDGILLTINDSGYYMGNNRLSMMGNISSPPLYIKYESGINSTIELASGKYIYPPQYIGYQIKDAYMNVNGYSVILTTDNELYSCGDTDKTYRLGLGDTTDRTSYTNISQLNNSGIVKIEGYDQGVYALSSGGDLYAWGNYAYNISAGQTPVYVTGNIKDIQLMGTCTDYIRYANAFVITNNNELYSCSISSNTSNEYGELLLGDTTFRSTFTKVGVDSDWEQVAPIYVFYDVLGDVSVTDTRRKGFIILLRKTDNSIYVASNITDLDIVPDNRVDLSINFNYNVNGYTNAIIPLDPTTEIRQLSGIYASNIISSADGFILVPTG